MKISQLKKIIREEIKHSLNEASKAISTAKELKQSKKDIYANGLDQAKYKKLSRSIPGAVADLANTLANLPKSGAPTYGDASDLCDAMWNLWEFSDEAINKDKPDFFKQAHADIQRAWNICNLLAGSGEKGLWDELAKEKDSLTVIFQKAAKAVKSLKTFDSQF